MSIKQTLLISVTLLTLFIAGFAGVGVFNAWEDKETFEFSKDSSETINLLLTSAGNWAVERGVTNAGLVLQVGLNFSVNFKAICFQHSNNLFILLQFLAYICIANHYLECP